MIGLLEAHFAQLVDYDFTAGMEDDLDEIAAGQEQRSAWLSRFYFGGEHGDEDSVARKGGLKKLVGQNLEDIDAREINSIRLFDDAEGREIHVRVGRFGPYLERMVVDPDNPDGDLISQRANLPEDLPPDELTLEYAEKLFSTPQEGRVLGVDPATGHEIVAREGRFGPYVTELLPEPKPEPEPEPDVTPVPVEELTSGGATKTATKTAAKKAAKKAPAKKATKKPPAEAAHGVAAQDDGVVIRHARRRLRLLSLPRVVGVDPESGDEITAQNGRYGPYLKKGTDSRSLATEEQMFTVTLEEALKIYSEPKRRGRQAAAVPPLRELGVDPVSEKPMVIKDGRFGPYVTDGETNASLRKGDEVGTITDERASELLADRRARGPAKKTTKKAAKKAPAKKTAAKKTAAKKTAAKKTAAKKTATEETTD